MAARKKKKKKKKTVKKKVAKKASAKRKCGSCGKRGHNVRTCSRWALRP